MNQRLEQFVHDHREDFDTEEPAKKVWDKIRLDMEPPKEKKTIILRLTRTTLSVAAAILLAIAVGFWYLGSRSTTTAGTQEGQLATKSPDVKPSGSEATAALHPPVDTTQKSDVPAPEKEQMAVTQPKEEKDNGPQDEESIIHEEMKHYARLVELKHEELKTIEKDEPLLYKQFASDAYKLDSVYHGLRKELPNHPNKEQLLEAMLQNLQLQMGLLNHQLDIIKQINHSKQKAYEKAYKTI
ncbi:MAG TPA: hypothetical protein VHC50_05730 [Puia sp.]|nr:hypothetical protein [Puia sp.]